MGLLPLQLDVVFFMKNLGSFALGQLGTGPPGSLCIARTTRAGAPAAPAPKPSAADLAEQAHDSCRVGSRV